MNDRWLRPEFWIAMAVVIAIKIRSSPKMTCWHRALSALIAVGSALVFTDPILARFTLPPETYGTAVAALVALSAEHLARQLLALRLEDLLKWWRGK